MEIQILSPQRLSQLSPFLIPFIRKYGERRITHRAIRWLQKLANSKEAHFSEGTLISIAVSQRKLIGIIAFGRFGLDESFIVVHPQHRKRKVGESLLYHALEDLEKVYTRVACDNIPSLKLCFSNGLVAFRLIRGPTGKPTLWLGGGKWTPKDVP